MVKAFRIVIFSLLLFTHVNLLNKNITIIGCGYTGLVLAGVLVHNGHMVTCVDIDEKKISVLNNKKMPIYEPSLQDLLFDSGNNQLFFTNDLKQTPRTELYYICVPTPSTPQGYCDLSFLYSAFSNLLQHLTTLEPKIICIKSTVPPGTMRILQNLLLHENKDFIQLIYNPEFMREGSAINDICTSNPIVLGGESVEALQTVEAFYTDFLNNKIITASFETAEIIKYAWNTFSATRIAFINELSYLCRFYNADINHVIQGIALSEKLLPTASIQPGPGYGGSCLPKDTSSFAKIMEEKGLFSSIVCQTIQSNREHKKRIIADIFSSLDSHNKQHTVALLGLSFKEHTNDCRNATSKDIIQALLNKNIVINAYDPKSIDTLKDFFPMINYFESPYDAVTNADCIVILNAWDEIREIDLNKVAELCHKKCIIDTKNILNPEQLKKYGFTYLNMGLTR